MKKIPFETMVLWMKYTIPAQTEEESLGMLRGLKANAPAEVFEQVLRIVKSEMNAERYVSLVSEL